MDEYEVIIGVDEMDKLANLFMKISNKHAHDDQSLTFFDREFKTVLGFDVFSSEFPISKGYNIYRENLADILLIRLENLNECYQQAFKEFLDMDVFSLSKSNVGREKSYASLYKMFKKSVVLPDTFIDEMYSSKHARHFYSAEEICLFREKWCSSQGLKDESIYQK
jgi:hypothetical protein